MAQPNSSGADKHLALRLKFSGSCRRRCAPLSWRKLKLRRASHERRTRPFGRGGKARGGLCFDLEPTLSSEHTSHNWLN